MKFSGADKIVNHIDYSHISGKQYESFEELRSDFAWFAHHLKTKPFDSEFNKDSIVRRSNKLVDIVGKEIFDLLACQECYEKAFSNPDDCFVTPCTKPHILIWSDCDSGFWPSKLIKLMDDDGMVYVRYFADHTYAILPPSKCFIFSEKAPEHELGSSKGDLYNLALKVISY